MTPARPVPPSPSRSVFQLELSLKKRVKIMYYYIILSVTSAVACFACSFVGLFVLLKMAKEDGFEGRVLELAFWGVCAFVSCKNYWEYVFIYLTCLSHNDA